jgi:hypothetical protein
MIWNDLASGWSVDFVRSSRLALLARGTEMLFGLPHSGISSVTSALIALADQSARTATGADIQADAGWAQVGIRSAAATRRKCPRNFDPKNPAATGTTMPGVGSLDGSTQQ